MWRDGVPYLKVHDRSEINALRQILLRAKNTRHTDIEPLPNCVNLLSSNCPFKGAFAIL